MLAQRNRAAQITPSQSQYQITHCIHCVHVWGGTGRGEEGRLLIIVAETLAVIAHSAMRYTTVKMRLRMTDAAGKTQITHLWGVGLRAQVLRFCGSHMGPSIDRDGLQHTFLSVRFKRYALSHNF